MNRGTFLFVVKVVKNLIERLVIIALIIAFAVPVYFLTESLRQTTYSGTEMYERYRPDDNESISFKELQKINNDVVGWISIDRTGIDYPLVHCSNNTKYLSCNALGKSSSGGAIFVDCDNSKDLTDFNTIIYGHHMASGLMFGNLDKFGEKGYFDKHKKGHIFACGKKYEIDFFAYIPEANGYDRRIYSPALTERADKDNYYAYIVSLSKFNRPVVIDENSRLVLLSTCNRNTTNGRSLLVGKLEEENRSAEVLGSEPTKIPYKLFSLGICPMLVILLILCMGKQKKRRK